MTKYHTLHYFSEHTYPTEFYVKIKEIDDPVDCYKFHTSQNLNTRFKYFEVVQVFFNHIIRGKLQDLHEGMVLLVGDVMDDEGSHEYSRVVAYNLRGQWVDFDEEMHSEQYCQIEFDGNERNCIGGICRRVSKSLNLMDYVHCEEDEKFNELKRRLEEVIVEIRGLIERSDSEVRKKYMYKEMQKLVGKWY